MRKCVQSPIKQLSTIEELRDDDDLIEALECLNELDDVRVGDHLEDLYLPHHLLSVLRLSQSISFYSKITRQSGQWVRSPDMFGCVAPLSLRILDLINCTELAPAAFSNPLVSVDNNSVVTM